MAKSDLIAIISIDEDNSPFVAGDKINIWYDSATESTIVVEHEQNTLVAGTDVSNAGDGGDFETAQPWTPDVEISTSFFFSGTRAAGAVTRSSTTSHTNTYSAKYLAPDAYAPIIKQSVTAYVVGEAFTVSCWVYTPSATPISLTGTATLAIASDPNVFPGTTLGRITQTSDPVVTVTACTDTWKEVKAKFTVNAANGGTVGVVLKLNTNSADPTGGILYIDDFHITSDNGYTTGVSDITSGPDLKDLTALTLDTQKGFINGSPRNTWQGGFQFCTGTTQTYFTGTMLSPSFPYTTRVNSLNNYACQAHVCDIFYDPTEIVITNASTSLSSDGTITIKAYSTAGFGTIAYFLNPTGLPEFNTTGGQTSGTFTNLSPGRYIVWMVDEQGCNTPADLRVHASVANEPQPELTNTYSEKYRVDYTDIQNVVASRVSIFERNFNGAYLQVNSGDPPFIRESSNTNVNNKFNSIVHTNCTLNLASERDLQYIGLFSQDDRKFQIRHERPVGTEIWRGLLVPSIFSEPFTQGAPYITTIRGTDGLQELGSADFLDRDGNPYSGVTSLILILSNILDRLDLALPIRVAANISNATHSGVLPFEETLIDVDGFYENDGTPWDCSRVLQSIIESFGAKIVQDGGYWNIIRVEEQYETYNVRLYTSAGVFSSTSTYNPILIISDPSLRINSAFAKGDHILEMVPSYGKVTIHHILFPRGSLLKGYQFNKLDERIEDSLLTFIGWGIFRTGPVSVFRLDSGQKDIGLVKEADLREMFLKNTQSAPSGVGNYIWIGNNYGLIKGSVKPGQLTEKTKSSVLAIGNLIDGNEVTLTSDVYDIVFSDVDKFSFGFDYIINLIPSTIRTMPPWWIRVGWSLKFGEQFYSKGNNGWSTNTAYQWNYIFEDKYGQHNSLNVKDIVLPGTAGVTTNRGVSVSIKIEGAETINATSSATLKGITTVYKETGYKVRVKDSGDNYVRYFVLSSGTRTGVYPVEEEPNDYHATTNPCFWAIESTLIDEFEWSVSVITIDNVALLFYPNGSEVETSEELVRINNKNYKEELEIVLEAGDAAVGDIHSKEYIYRNVFLDTYDNYMNEWTRDNVSESLTLQEILMKSIVAQYRTPTFKFSGTLIGFSDINFLTTIKHTLAAPTLTLTNEEFTGSASSWANTGSGTSWAYDSNDVAVSLSGAVDSKYFGQSLTGYAGQRISVEYLITRTVSTGVRGDWFVCALISGGVVVQEIVLVNDMVADSSFTDVIKFSFANDFDTIAFYVRNIAGTADCTYDVDYFRVVAQSVIRYYTPNYLTLNDKDNEYSGEWMQILPVVASTDTTIDDSGEGNTDTEGGGGRVGGATGGDFNFDFNADFLI